MASLRHHDSRLWPRIRPPGPASSGRSDGGVPTEEYSPATYGDRIAEVYDDWYGGGPATEAAVAALAALAGPGPVLELGIGTGRVALPLAARGIEVHGMDASEAMVARLRAKPGAAALPVTLGDFADVPVAGRFALVFVVANTFAALLTQEDQVRCFRSVAEHLADEGVFVVEASVPDPTRYVRGQSTWVEAVEADHVVLIVTQHDPVHQRLTSQHVVLTESGVRLYPAQLRYAWPSQLDLMAQLAGLRLRERWADWRRTPFTAASTRHVSVYGRP